LACRPGSVHPLSRAGGHPSRAAVADSLVRSTRGLRRAAFKRPRRHNIASATSRPPDLAPGGVYRAAAVTCSAGGLLHHRFTLTVGLATPGRRRSVFCGTFPRVAPGRRYRPPCPAEPGPSSAIPAYRNRRDRPANSPVAPQNCKPCRRQALTLGAQRRQRRPACCCRCAVSFKVRKTADPLSKQSMWHSEATSRFIRNIASGGASSARHTNVLIGVT
jgi:hypothetical protein